SAARVLAILRRLTSSSAGLYVFTTERCTTTTSRVPLILHFEGRNHNLTNECLSSGMAAHVHSLATAVPAHVYDQEGILAMMKAWHGQDRRVSRLLSGMYLASAIDRRHSVIDDFRPGSNGGFFYQPAAGEADDHQATAGAVRDPA